MKRNFYSINEKINKIMVVIFCIFIILSSYNSSYAEIGKSVADFEHSKFFELYKIEKYEPYKKEDKTIYKYGVEKYSLTIEIVVKNNNIEEENLMTFSNLPSDIRLQCVAITLALVNEASGGNISLDDFNTALAQARETGEAAKTLASYLLRIAYTPISSEGLSMICIFIKK